MAGAEGIGTTAGIAFSGIRIGAGGAGPGSHISTGPDGPSGTTAFCGASSHWCCRQPGSRSGFVPWRRATCRRRVLTRADGGSIVIIRSTVRSAIAQISQLPGFREGAARYSEAGGAGSAATGAAAGKGDRHGGAVAGDHIYKGGQRGVHEGKFFVRTDDAARPPCEVRRRRHDALSFSRQERADARYRGRR
jgi:hypothetical protein